MTRLLYALVRLYPREWRDRYEPEFRALLADAEPHWKDALDLLKEGLKQQFLHPNAILAILVCGIAASLIAAVTLQIIPREWKSSAVVSFRVPSGSRESHAPNWYPTFERVRSRESALNIMEHVRPYMDQRSRQYPEQFIQGIQRHVKVEGIVGSPPSALFSITYRNRDPYLANLVTRDLVRRFAEESNRNIQDLIHSGVPRELVLVPTVTIDAFLPSKRAPAPSKNLIIGLALAEGSQAGLIFALLRRRFRHRTIPQQNP